MPLPRPRSQVTYKPIECSFNLSQSHFNISIHQFFTGWWFALDAAAVHPEKTELKDVFQICGVFGTISFFM